MAHMKVKWSDKGKGTEMWCKILVIAEGKMSLSQDAEYSFTVVVIFRLPLSKLYYYHNK